MLHIHFLRQGIKSTMFCSQWFLTLFSYRCVYCLNQLSRSQLVSRFPLEVVFRIYDNCLANGIEAIFGYSVILLKKNEDTLLGLKFDEILAFMNSRLFDCYLVRFFYAYRDVIVIRHPSIKDEDDQKEVSVPKYKVDEFVQEAAALRITPFMLDCYRHEYEDLMVCMIICVD